MLLPRTGLILLLTIEIGFAAQQWTKLTTPHFELYTSAGARAGKRTIQHFERVRSFFVKLLKIAPGKSRPVRVLAFGSEREFRPFQWRDNSPAFYLKVRDQDWIVMASLGAGRERTAVHEYFHLVVSRLGIPLPLWLNEGAAELYSNLEPAGGKVIVGKLLRGRYLRLQRPDWIPLKALTSADQKSAFYSDGRLANLFYSESWLLAHMLYLSQAYRGQSAKFMKVIVGGGSAAEAFQKAYGKTLDEVMLDLERYHRGVKEAAVYDIKLERSTQRPAVEKIDRFDVLLDEARILSSVRRYEEADRRFEEYRQSRPDDPRLAEALGYRYWITGDVEGARRQYARAVELGSEDPQVYVDYAMLLRSSSGTSAEVTPLLVRALELKPDFRDARQYLGYAYLQDEKYQRAATQFKKIRTVSPEKAVDLFRGLALAYAGLGDRNSAVRYAARARKQVRNPEESARVDNLYQYLDALARGEAARARSLELARRGDAGYRPIAGQGFRHPGAAIIHGPNTVTVNGSLNSIDCLGVRARLNLSVSDQTIRLAIYDPNGIVVNGARGQAVELSCDQKQSLPVVIEYLPRDDAELGTAGAVRSITFE